MKMNVDPAELHRASQTCHQFSEDYTAVYQRLLNSASNMGDAWKADDNLAFVAQINGFCDNLKAMADHLEQASQALETQAKNYEQIRDENITVVKQLAN